MNTRNVVIDADKTIGRNPVLTDVKVAYAYVNGQRTDEIEGFRYEVALPDRGFDKLVVKIDGEQQIEKPIDNYPTVSFDGLELNLGWTPNGYVVRATAKRIRISDAKAKA